MVRLSPPSAEQSRGTVCGVAALASTPPVGATNPKTATNPITIGIARFSMIATSMPFLNVRLYPQCVVSRSGSIVFSETGKFRPR